MDGVDFEELDLQIADKVGQPSNDYDKSDPNDESDDADVINASRIEKELKDRFTEMLGPETFLEAFTRLTREQP